jgi:uncharacterized repeat protein (TIGR04052 family)
MFVALVVVLSACGDDDGTTDTGPADTSTGDTATPDTSTEDTGTPDGGGDGGPTMAVTLTFAAKVGEEEFACGADYDGIGTTDAMITTSDFRFYVYDVRLVTDADEEVPVVIADDGMWALDGTVLLDFEDGTSGCDSGNSALNSTVSGTVAEGTYTGVRFRMGVPFAQNHNIDAATAPPPLNVTSMWWNWQGGYKFLRIDGSSSGIAGWRQHLGSAGCDGSPAGGVTMCTHPNIVAVELDGFDAVTHTIVADLALLLADTDIDTNTEMTPPGCMASLDDPDCAGVFAHLGLDYMGVPGVAQTFFRLE